MLHTAVWGISEDHQTWCIKPSVTVASCLWTGWTRSHSGSRRRRVFRSSVRPSVRPSSLCASGHLNRISSCLPQASTWTWRWSVYILQVKGRAQNTHVCLKLNNAYNNCCSILHNCPSGLSDFTVTTSCSAKQVQGIISSGTITWVTWRHQTTRR